MASAVNIAPNDSAPSRSGSYAKGRGSANGAGGLAGAARVTWRT